MSIPVVVLERLPENVECSQCNQRFVCQRQLTLHEAEHKESPAPKHKVSQVFSCMKCQRHFATHQNLRRHENRAHQRVPHLFRCTHCGMGFALQDMMNMHTLTTHEGMPRSEANQPADLPCSPDSGSCSCAESENYGPSKQEECIELDNQQHEKHVSIGTSNSPSVCVELPNCHPRALPQERGVFPHQETCSANHSSNEVKEELPTSLGDASNCESNEEDDIGVATNDDDRARPFKCQSCYLRFVHHSSLTKHKCMINNRQSFFCSLCGCEFADRCSLINHVRKHFPTTSTPRDETHVHSSYHNSVSFSSSNDGKANSSSGRDSRGDYCAVSASERFRIENTCAEPYIATETANFTSALDQGMQSNKSFPSSDENLTVPQSSLPVTAEDPSLHRLTFSFSREHAYNIPENHGRPPFSTVSDIFRHSQVSQHRASLGGVGCSEHMEAYNCDTNEPPVPLIGEESYLETSIDDLGSNGDPLKSKRKMSLVSKIRRDHGLEHINGRGFLVRARCMGEGCNSDCRFNCHSKISSQERDIIFTEYWRLGNNVLQWAYLARHTTVYVPKRITAGRRTASRRYWFEVNGKFIKVCKSMFISTLDISESLIRTATFKQSIGVKAFTDLRGKTSNRLLSTITKKGQRRKKRSQDVLGSASKDDNIRHIDREPSCIGALDEKGIKFVNGAFDGQNMKNTLQSCLSAHHDRGEVGTAQQITQHMHSKQALHVPIERERGSGLSTHDIPSSSVAITLKSDVKCNGDCRPFDEDFKSYADDVRVNCFPCSADRYGGRVKNRVHENQHDSDEVAERKCYAAHPNNVNGSITDPSILCGAVDFHQNETGDEYTELVSDPKGPSKSAINKLKRDHGFEHINSRGCMVRARQMGSGCSEDCRSKCHSKISIEERQSIFKEYWGLGSNVLQWAYIAKYTTLYAPKKVTGGRRTASRRYWFEVQGRMVNVCKSMFITTLDISDSIIKTAIIKQSFGPDGATFSDMRGRHSKRPPSEVVEDEAKRKRRKKRESADRSFVNETFATPSTSENPFICPKTHLSLPDSRELSTDHENRNANAVEERLYSSAHEISFDTSFVRGTRNRIGIVRHSCDTGVLESSDGFALASPFVKGEPPDESEHGMGEVCDTSTCTELNISCVASLSGQSDSDCADTRTEGFLEIPSATDSSKTSMKTLRDHGIEHVNSRGQVVRGRRMGPGCGESCRSKCETKISVLERELIFSEYWALGNNSLQWAYLAKSTTLYAPKKVTAGRRTASRRYWFEVGGRLVNVCKSMFVNTLDISDSIINTAIAKQSCNFKDTPFSDNRGKHSKRCRAVSDHMYQSVIEHVNTLPRVNWRCCENDISKVYLEEKVGSVANMYRMYKDWLESKTTTSSKQVTERQYRDIFLKEFDGLSIYSSKRKCNLCSDTVLC